MSALELYHDLIDAIDRALGEMAVIDPDDGTIATMPNGDGVPVWVDPGQVLAHVAGRVTEVFRVHETL